MTEKLNFKSLSFRLMNEIHTETEEEIKNGQIVPAHFIFPMYVDLIADSIPKDFKKVFGFNPIDDPLLKIVFEKREFIIEKEFEKKLLLPNRDKEHKKIKTFATCLLWHSMLKLIQIKLILQNISEKILKKCLKLITDKDFEMASAQVPHEKEELKRVIGLICERK